MASSIVTSQFRHHFYPVFHSCPECGRPLSSVIYRLTQFTHAPTQFTHALTPKQGWSFFEYTEVAINPFFLISNLFEQEDQVQESQEVASGLFDPDNNLFRYIVYFCSALLIIAAILGLIWEYRRKLQAREVSILGE